ncbi:MAG: helix-turn-helix domain-containing protein, partial [Treponema sp.]|nr:helix-turn-helix domain-containing protein [Treponema sp.]
NLRKRFVEEGFEAVLERKKRDRPPVIKTDGEAEARIIALTCSAPSRGGLLVRTLWRGVVALTPGAPGQALAPRARIFCFEFCLRRRSATDREEPRYRPGAPAAASAVLFRKPAACFFLHFFVVYSY